MFKHLLIPLDLRRNLEGIAEAVRGLALERQARVSILHVIEVIEDFDDVEIRSFYDRLERRARRRLEPLREELREIRLDAALEIRLGQRTQEILRFAHDQGVDLLVMRSRGAHQTPTGAWPTISLQVAMLSPVPVLLLRDPQLLDSQPPS